MPTLKRRRQQRADVTIRRISSGGVYDSKIGYCRAVVAGGLVHVAGTAAGGAEVSEDVVEQCRSALEIIGIALNEAGSGFEHAVRVRYILPDRHDFEPCWPLLRETFGANPPVATMIESGLIDLKYKIEIEVTALMPAV
jgi:enamine deaminase RidA (YjgF/YER057c/UK114 family)